MVFYIGNNATGLFIGDNTYRCLQCSGTIYKRLSIRGLSVRDNERNRQQYKAKD